MKLLVTGCKGQVGFELQRALAPLGEIVAVDLGKCDLADAKAIRKRARDICPTSPPLDPTESDQERATAGNALAPGIFL